MRPPNIVSCSVTQLAINGHTPFVCWYSYRKKLIFEQKSMFQRKGNHFIKRANIVSIFYMLKVAPTRIENNFKGAFYCETEKLNYINVLSNFDASKIKWFTVDSIVVCK